MASRLKIYSLHKQVTLLPNASHSNEWNLRNDLNRFKVKSIFFDYSLNIPDPVVPAMAEWVNPDFSNTVKFQLRVGSVNAVELVHSVFDEASMSHAIVPANNDFNGRRIYMHRAGQLQFDSWIIENLIEIAVDVYSSDKVNTYAVFYDVVLEIEDLY